MESKIGKTDFTGCFTGIPHKGKEISFQYPAFRGTCGSIIEEIEIEGLIKSNSSQTASLAYYAFQNLNKRLYSEVKSIFKRNYLLEFTGNLFLPKSNQEINNGVILDLNPFFEKRKKENTLTERLLKDNTKNNDFIGFFPLFPYLPNTLPACFEYEIVMEKNSLIKRLQDNDESVKFIPFGYKIMEQSIRQLSKNKYILARYSEEGAEKIAEVASKYKSKPFLDCYEDIDEEKISLSALSNCDGSLAILANIWKLSDEGHAFGICSD